MSDSLKTLSASRLHIYKGVKFWYIIKSGKSFSTSIPYIKLREYRKQRIKAKTISKGDGYNP